MKILIVLITLFALSAKAEPLALGVGIFSPSLNINVLDKDERSTVKFIPNNSSSSNFLYSHGNIGVSIGKQNELTDEKLLIPFESDFDDYQFSILTGKWNYFFYYQKYRSYFVDNASEVNSSYNEFSDESHFEDMHSQNIGFKLLRVHAPDKFELDSSFGIASTQSDSAGSWLSGYGIALSELSSPTKGFAPSYAGSEFDFMKGLRKAKAASLTLEGGYSHSWIANSYFLNLTLMLGLSLQDKTLTTSSETLTETGVATSGTLGLSFGYNSEKHKLAVQTFGLIQNAVIQDNRLDFSTVNGGLVYAYRFGDTYIPVSSEISRFFDQLFQ